MVPLAELNQAFSDPERITLAYYQASLVVQHIITAHGEEGLRRLLRAYGEGRDTDTAIREGLGVPMAALQESFTAFVDTRFAPVRAALALPEDGDPAAASSLQALRTLAASHPRSYPLQMAVAQALQDAGERDGAMTAYDGAEAAMPVTIGAESPLALLAKLALEAGDRPRAAAALERLIARDGDNVEAARQLVTLLDNPSDAGRQLRAEARVAELDPFDAAAHTALGRQALADGDADTAARWFRVALAAGPRDQVAAHTDLAEAYWQTGQSADARRQTLAALELAPTYARAQDLLLAIVDERK